MFVLKILEIMSGNVVMPAGSLKAPPSYKSTWVIEILFNMSTLLILTIKNVVSTRKKIICENKLSETALLTTINKRPNWD